MTSKFIIIHNLWNYVHILPIYILYGSFIFGGVHLSLSKQNNLNKLMRIRTFKHTYNLKNKCVKISIDKVYKIHYFFSATHIDKQRH